MLHGSMSYFTHDVLPIKCDTVHIAWYSHSRVSQKLEEHANTGQNDTLAL